MILDIHCLLTAVASIDEDLDVSLEQRGKHLLVVPHPVPHSRHTTCQTTHRGLSRRIPVTARGFEHLPILYLPVFLEGAVDIHVALLPVAALRRNIESLATATIHNPSAYAAPDYDACHSCIDSTVSWGAYLLGVGVGEELVDGREVVAQGRVVAMMANVVHVQPALGVGRRELHVAVRLRRPAGLKCTNKEERHVKSH